MIALLLLAAIWLYAKHTVAVGGSTELPTKWLGFLGITSLIFGYTVKASRRVWKSRRFWTLLVIFFVAHCGVGVAILARADKVPLLVFAFLGPAENELLTVFLSHFMQSARG
jgi:hypothetical protein